MMATNSPKRSHSLIHHKQHIQSKQLDSTEELLKQQPIQSISTTPPRSVSHHHQVRLVRSSSLSHHHNKKAPTRSKSLPQKPIKTSTSLIPPIPSPSPPPPFLFLQYEPPSPRQQQQQQQQIVKPPRRSSSLKINNNNKKKPIILSTKNNEEVTKALLEWKHKSVFKVDWANMFSPSVELWKMNDNIFGSVEDLLNFKSENGHHDMEVDTASNSLWLEDESFVPKKEIASYLGKLDPFCHRVLKSYMDYFDFTDMKLDEAFRKLCSKLYFKAEAQEIDRILEVFSHRYWNNNKFNSKIYKSADVVYTITYSIMLLNTDLHLVQISSHAKMTCALFCENAMSTVLEQKISLEDDDEDLETWKEQLENSLKDIYTSVKNNGILQPVSDDEPKSFLKRMGSLTQRKKRSPSLSSHQSHSST